jgi:hypothetical protein
MRSKTQFAPWLALLALAALLAPAAGAQLRGRGPNPQAKPPQNEGREVRQAPPEKRPPHGRMLPPGKGADPVADLDGAMPPNMLDRLRNLPPEQQERFLNNNRRFLSMPPAQQRMVRENLRRWNAMSPAEREEMRAREQVWRSMTPEERRRVREEILPRWRQLEPPRRQAILRRLGALRGLTEEERQKRLADERFLQGMSDEDQELLRTLARLRLPPPEPPT